MPVVVSAWIDGLYFFLAVRGGQLAALARSHRSWSSRSPGWIISDKPSCGCLASKSPDYLYFITNWAHWAKEAELENLNLSRECCQCVSSWHNAELFALAQSAGSEYYVQNSVNRQDKFKFCGVLKDTTTVIFAYYSDLLLHGDCGALAIWHMDLTEYVVIALLHFQRLLMTPWSVSLVSIPYGQQWPKLPSSIAIRRIP